MPFLQVLNGLFHSELDCPCWVSHVVDDHVHEDLGCVDLDKKLIYLLLKHHVLDHLSLVECHKFSVAAHE